MKNTLNEALYGDLATLVTADITDHHQALHPAELALITGTSEKRAREFSTGRLCAQQALHHLGIDDFPILRGEHREPLWPGNVVGSISHCRDIAGAVVADKQHVKSVGLDIEIQKQLNPAIARHVCTEKEKCWLGEQAAAEQNLALLLIFSIKEAVFKCVYQATRAQLRFQQCDVMPALVAGIADVQIHLSGLLLAPNELEVRSCLTETHVYSAAIWHYLPAVG
jgi:4'-phosphopantetheinyl transferase EntD